MEGLLATSVEFIFYSEVKHFGSWLRQTMIYWMRKKQILYIFDVIDFMMIIGYHEMSGPFL